MITPFNWIQLMWIWILCIGIFWFALGAGYGIPMALYIGGASWFLGVLMFYKSKEKE